MSAYFLKHHRIYNSVFKENKTTDASSANIYSVNNAAVKEDITLSSLASRLVSIPL